jgi:hypothetical protein
LLSPFDCYWFGPEWLPIIDIYLLIVLGASLAFGRGSPESRRRNAAIALILMSANYGLRGAAHHRALALAPRVFGPTLPPPCSGGPSADMFVDRWPLPRPSSSLDQPGRRCLVEIAAIPTFISPFRWRIVAHLSNAYELHDIDLLDPRFLTSMSAPDGIWRTNVRYPDVWTPAVVAAAQSESAQVFLGFSSRAIADRANRHHNRAMDGYALRRRTDDAAAANRPTAEVYDDGSCRRQQSDPHRSDFALTPQMTAGPAQEIIRSDRGMLGVAAPSALAPGCDARRELRRSAPVASTLAGDVSRT